MYRSSATAAQRGATLVLALIMIVLLSLIVVSAFNLTNSNLKAVGNMQSRDESVAAANAVVEQLVGSNFYEAVTTQTWTVDINKDSAPDYSVAVSAPTCMRAIQTSEASPSDGDFGDSSGAFWSTDWDLKATVTDSVTGAAVVIRQGVRVKMDATTRDARCP